MVCAAQGYDQDKLAEAVRGADLVIIPAGVPRKPGMTRDDLFKVRGILACQGKEQRAQAEPHA